ncbi:MAG: hypothetical protein HDR75_10005 [Bacteroides sp.]|nr:hypothetical protein [Bacteroides sp.]
MERRIPIRRQLKTANTYGKADSDPPPRQNAKITLYKQKTNPTWRRIGIRLSIAAISPPGGGAESASPLLPSLPADRNPPLHCCLPTTRRRTGIRLSIAAFPPGGGSESASPLQPSHPAADRNPPLHSRLRGKVCFVWISVLLVKKGTRRLNVVKKAYLFFIMSLKLFNFAVKFTHVKAKKIR